MALELSERPMISRETILDTSPLGQGGKRLRIRERLWIFQNHKTGFFKITSLPSVSNLDISPSIKALGIMHPPETWTWQSEPETALYLNAGTNPGDHPSLMYWLSISSLPEISLHCFFQVQNWDTILEACPLIPVKASWESTWARTRLTYDQFNSHGQC